MTILPGLLVELGERINCKDPLQISKFTEYSIASPATIHPEKSLIILDC